MKDDGLFVVTDLVKLMLSTFTGNLTSVAEKHPVFSLTNLFAFVLH